MDAHTPDRQEAYTAQSTTMVKSITDETINTDQIADTSVHGRRNLMDNGAIRRS